MSQQPYIQDVEPGQELTPLVKQPTTRQLVMYAGASGDFYEIHYDKDYALAQRLPGVILHGASPAELEPVVAAYRKARPAQRFDHLAANPAA